MREPLLRKDRGQLGANQPGTPARVRPAQPQGGLVQRWRQAWSGTTTGGVVRDQPSFAAIANDGILMRPRLVTEVRDPSGRVIAQFESEELERPLSPENAAAMAEMMVAVVSSGTGSAGQIPGVTVAGKTGTAQHGDGLDPHAWFTAFAPAETPQVAVAVIVLDGGSLGSDATGGQVAAPIARAVIEAALSG